MFGYVIWKFEIPIADEFNIDMPIGARILDVNTQHDVTCCIWASVQQPNSFETRKFKLYGTGQPIDDEDVNSTYIGSFHLLSGHNRRNPLVYHLFEVVKAE